MNLQKVSNEESDNTTGIDKSYFNIRDTWLTTMRFLQFEGVDPQKIEEMIIKFTKKWNELMTIPLSVT